MNHTFPVRITLRFSIDDAANGRKEQFDALNKEFAARSFIRGTGYSIIAQYPLTIRAQVTRKLETELARKPYVETVERITPDVKLLPARESFYRARISDYNP